MTTAHDDATVLVVDDDRSMRHLLRYILEQDGHAVVEAEDGEAALAVVEGDMPDAVLLDANMPGLDGFTVCARMRRQFSTDAPIIMVTALEDDRSITRAFDVGATDYVAKPINPVLLRHRLRRTIAAARHRARVDYLAHYDPVTGLPNRVLLLDRFESVLARARRMREQVAVLYLDLDGFKPVNDTWGHEAGDLLLKAVGDRIRGFVRSCDTVARLGGDEFVVLLTTGVSPTGVTIVAEQITALIATPFSLTEGTVSISASLGAAVFPTDGRDPRSLLRNADAAMYAAKQAGGAGYRLFGAGSPIEAPPTTRAVPDSAPDHPRSSTDW